MNLWRKKIRESDLAKSREKYNNMTRAVPMNPRRSMLLDDGSRNQVVEIIYIALRAALALAENGDNECTFT